MYIYYSGTDGTRRFQNCNLSESEISGMQATDGVQTYKIYMIFNTAEGDSTVITFGGKSQIAENLRDSFWRCIVKHNIPTFDVDEWYANINFVTPDNPNAKKNIMKNSLKKSK